MNFPFDGFSIFLLVFCTVFSLGMTFKPKLLLYVTTIFTLIVAGTVGYFSPTLKVSWWISYGEVFLLYFPVLNGLSSGKLKKAAIYSTLSATLLLLLGSFFFISLFSTIISGSPIIQIITATKTYFMMGGLWLFLALYPLSEESVIFWLKILWYIGLLQILPVLYQYLFIRSWRIEHNINPVEAADSIVGTFGGSPVGGGLGAVLVFYLIVCLVVWLAFAKLKSFSWKKSLPVLFILWFPILFTEVKAVFIYLPVAIIILYRRYSYQQPKKFLLILLSLVAVLIVMLFLWNFMYFGAQDKNFAFRLKRIFSYSFVLQPDKNNAVGKTRFSRISVLQFWWQKHGLDNLSETLFGHGLGSSRTQGLVMGCEAIKWSGKKLDYTGLSTLLWEVGLLGTGFFLAMIVLFYVLAGKLSDNVSLPIWQRALADGLQAVMPLILLSLPYRNDIPFAAPMMFIIMGIFGLIFRLNNQLAEHAC